MAPFLFDSPPLELKDSSLLRQKAFADGKWIDSVSGRTSEITDPGSGNTFATCPGMDSEDVDATIKSSAQAFETYRKMTPRRRAKILLEWYNLIMENKDDLALLLTYENGKPLKDAFDETEYAFGFVWWPRLCGESSRSVDSKAPRPQIPQWVVCGQTCAY